MRDHDFAANAILEFDLGPSLSAFARDRQYTAASKPGVDHPRAGFQSQVFLRIREVVSKPLPSGLRRTLPASVPLERRSAAVRPGASSGDRAARVTESARLAPRRT